MLWTRSLNLKANAERQYAVLDPDLEIRGGGLQKNVFWPFGPQYGLTMWGGEGVLVPSLVSTTDTENTV